MNSTEALDTWMVSAVRALGPFAPPDGVLSTVCSEAFLIPRVISTEQSHGMKGVVSDTAEFYLENEQGALHSRQKQRNRHHCHPILAHERDSGLVCSQGAMGLPWTRAHGVWLSPGVQLQGCQQRLYKASTEGLSRGLSGRLSPVRCPGKHLENLL